LKKEAEAPVITDIKTSEMYGSGEMMKKLKVALVFGGRSPEHEVSLVSALGIASQINKEKNDMLLIKITKEGQWIMLDNKGVPFTTVEQLANADGMAVMLGDPTRHGLVLTGGKTPGRTIPVDVIFPILHGPFGEDGTVQGLISLSDIACVGAGVLGSALGMDKVIMKQLFIQNDLETADFIWFLRGAWEEEPDAIIRGIKETIGYPCFVKPANAGSSVGISKVHAREELMPAITLASEYDRKILVEKYIDARELECAVLGNDAPEASIVGEIVPSNEFYDYNAKYVDEKSQTLIPADIPDSVTEQVRYKAVAAFKTLDCAGMSRVDFLMEKKTQHVYLNEINTIPGFTPISMYAKLWEASGLSYPDLIDRLIELAVERQTDIMRSKFYR
jgi:D-alanine-D-alanine ligase